jgi:hypothetical protein
LAWRFNLAFAVLLLPIAAFPQNLSVPAQARSAAIMAPGLTGKMAEEAFDPMGDIDQRQPGQSPLWVLTSVERPRQLVGKPIRRWWLDQFGLHGPLRDDPGALNDFDE